MPRRRGQVEKVALGARVFLLKANVASRLETRIQVVDRFCYLLPTLEPMVVGSMGPFRIRTSRFERDPERASRGGEAPHDVDETVDIHWSRTSRKETLGIEILHINLANALDGT